MYFAFDRQTSGSALLLETGTGSIITTFRPCRRSASTVAVMRVRSAAVTAGACNAPLSMSSTGSTLTGSSTVRCARITIDGFTSGTILS